MGEIVGGVEEEENAPPRLSIKGSTQFRALIVVGAGTTSGNYQNEDVLEMGIRAYRALRLRGLNDSDIRILTQDGRSLDVNGDGSVEEVGKADFATLGDLALNWLPQTEHAVLYLVGLGNVGEFMVNPTQALPVATLNEGMSIIETKIPGYLLTIIDSPYSGSMMAPTPPRRTLMMTSGASDQVGYFSSKGVHSFSNFFWSSVALGEGLLESFNHGKQSASLQQRQRAEIDGNGDGIADRSSPGHLSGLCIGGCTRKRAQTARTRKTKAVLIAGDGPGGSGRLPNHLWPPMEGLVLQAYSVLTIRGIPSENIRVLSAGPVNRDLNQDGTGDMLEFTSDSLEESLTVWAADADEVLVFVTGHGSQQSPVLYMSNNDKMTGAEIAAHLDTLQAATAPKTTVVVESCYAGNYIPPLTTNFPRTIITSANAFKEASFSNRLSFSLQLWSELLLGGDWRSAVTTATQVWPEQVPLEQDVLNECIGGCGT